MTCRCGHTFNWSEVPAVVPCDRVHEHPKFGPWGTTCPGCTWKATAKLLALRTALIILGVIALAVAAFIAIVVGAVVLVSSPIWLFGMLLWCIRDALIRRFPADAAQQARAAVF